LQQDIPQVYRQRLETRQALVQRLERRDDRLANGRLVAFLAAAGAVAFGYMNESPAAYVFAAVFFLTFVALAAAQAAARAARRRAQAAADFNARGLRRVEENWHGDGPNGQSLLGKDHVNAHDLDIVGEGSLFQRVCLAQTRAGQARLARWLTAYASVEEIERRQEAVRELLPELDLREETVLHGAAVSSSVHPETLQRWTEKPTRLPGSWLLWLSAGLALFSAASLLLLLYESIATPFAIAFSLNLLLLWRIRTTTHSIFHDAEEAGQELDVLRHLLALIERQHWTSPLLTQLQQKVRHEAPKGATGELKRLSDFIGMSEGRHNQVLAFLNILVLWEIPLAYAVERWRLRHGSAVSDWLDAVAEFETFVSLSGYAFESPSHVVPSAKEGAAAAAMEEVRHPLLPECVPNDLTLGGGVRLYIVSGSNMSGKTTLLRTIGVNFALAMAGAPVRAARFEFSPAAVGACIRIHEDLFEGRSRFYAEIERLRRILAAAEAGPVLFLIDEILHGTNSRDRAVGARALLEALLKRDAAGLVTTHDLAITEAPIGGASANVHFTDQMQGDRLQFDYRLRSGVVQGSNALELMRSLGFPV
jgi:hypothetical protein